MLYRWNSTLVVAHGKTPASTQSAVTAATQLGIDKVHLLLMGPKAAARTPSVKGVTKIVYMPQVESVDALKAAIDDQVVKHNCTHVVGTTNSLLPEVAKLLHVPIVQDVVAIKSPEIFETGASKEEAKCPETLHILEINPDSFEPAEIVEKGAAVETLREPMQITQYAYKAAPPILLLLLGFTFIPVLD